MENSANFCFCIISPILMFVIFFIIFIHLLRLIYNFSKKKNRQIFFFTRGLAEALKTFVTFSNCICKSHMQFENFWWNPSYFPLQNSEQSRASELREHPFDEHMPNDEQHIINQCRSNGKSSVKNDYLRLATAIDRIAFIFYLLLFTIFAIAYSIWFIRL